MKFEYLPNEIFVECFEYLNTLDIFYSFDQLNNRFNQLIRNISLHLNFQDVNKSTFDQLCSKIFFNPDIKLRIISLKLFNSFGYNQIQKFISSFPLNRYPHLRSLTLIDLNSNQVESITFMLLLLTNLSYFSFPSLMYPHDPCEIMSALQISKIKTLSMPNLSYDLDFAPEMTKMTHLTILFCYLVYLFQLLKYTPLLKYLNIKRIGQKNSDGDKLIYDNFEVIYLEKLIIGEYEDSLEHLQILLKKTLNLKIFTIVTTLYQMEMINANYWQDLITISLPRLNVFNFKFWVIFCENYNFLLYAFQQFQTDFWYKEHHWYTIHEFHESSASIYTIPYVWNKYELMLQTATSSNLLINNLNIFDNVTNLIVQTRAISDDFQYYFLNVKLLKLKNETEFMSDPVDFELTIKHISCLRKIMNFSKVKQLKIWRGFRMESSSVLLQILKEAPQLSSLLIEKTILVSFMDNNNELCEYLNKMIDELDISKHGNDPFIKSNELDLFCKTFANLKQFECCMDEPNNVLYIMDHLPKLTFIKVHYSSRTYSEDVCECLRNAAYKRNINCIIQYR